MARETIIFIIGVSLAFIVGMSRIRLRRALLLGGVIGFVMNLSFQLPYGMSAGVIAGSCVGPFELVIVTLIGRVCRRACVFADVLRDDAAPSPSPRVCLSCAYDLTSNVSGVCPECGTNQNKAAGDAPST